ncbi:hypothetical protein [Rhodanobacter sp. C03]|uniref:hypothetical protein n=1 Tax=Rhodanobacter sp. C03 TaxID=1945858 RepID=UPI0009850034|nr:hypothetical protein [Rhodanobacter sp. C03]OOG59562.1 hypothetical protein B0E48_01755 [Rhodanobacter sp. C03]
MHESDRLFIDLQPPPDGLQRLQRTIANRSDGTRRHSLRLAGAGAFAMFLLALAWLLPGVIARHRETTELMSALHAAVTPPTDGIQVVDGAAIELPSGQAGVRLYLVQSASPAARTLRH